MTKVSQESLAQAVLKTHGKTFAEEVGIPLKNTPAPLFQLLVASLLLSARIPARNAVSAARALRKAKLTNARKMADATWQERVDVITWHGYKRYDESTATMLGQTAGLALDRYGGDLRKLREEAGREVTAEKQLLKHFKGIGDVGADIFLREVQSIWDETFPYADGRVLRAAGRLGLPEDAKGLASLVPQQDYPRLVAGLVRVDLAKAHDAVRADAA